MKGKMRKGIKVIQIPIIFLVMYVLAYYFITLYQETLSAVLIFFIIVLMFYIGRLEIDLIKDSKHKDIIGLFAFFFGGMFTVGDGILYFGMTVNPFYITLPIVGKVYTASPFLMHFY